MSLLRWDNPFQKKLSVFIALSPDEIRCLAELQSEPIAIRRGAQLINEGQTGHRAYILHSGWAYSYKDLSNGNRQIISFKIAGDCLGLRSILLRSADHSASVLTDAVVSGMDGPSLLEKINRFPRLGAAFFWAASRDESIVVEHLVSVGRRNATERMAHFFMELAERLSLVGLAKEGEFKCPLSQEVLADALGLTAIHVNRVLRQFRERKLLTLHAATVKIHNPDELKRLAGYRGGYLD